MKVLVGLSTGEYIRKADFLPYFLGLEKPVGTLISTIHNQSPAKSRNILIQQALANDCTHVFLIDDDMAIPPDTLLKLLSHDKEVITGLYLMRNYPHFPVIFGERYPNGFNKFVFLSPEKDGIVKITGCGLGCVLIKTDVFRKMQEPYVRLGEIEADGWCDDVGFFNRVSDAGFDIFCDLDARVGHMTQMNIWPTKTDKGWFSEYKSECGNVLVPQTVEVGKEVANDSRNNK